MKAVGDSKQCSTCKETLSLSSFGKSKSTPDGLDPRCKTCIRKPKARTKEPEPIRNCAFCKVSKPIEQFPYERKRNDGRGITCRTCVYQKRKIAGIPEKSLLKIREASRLYNIKTKEIAKTILVEKLGNKCAHCGISPNDGWPLECFDFHHIDPSKKDGLISKLVQKRKNLDKAIKEIDNCLLLCATCHRREHYKIKMETEKNTGKRYAAKVGKVHPRGFTAYDYYII